MSNYALLFPSNYLAAADLEGQDRDLKIKAIVPSEEVGQKKDKRPIVHFYNMPKGLVLNKTNAKRIAKLYGPDTDNWIDKFVTLYPSECDFGDETVPCLRVRPEAPSNSQKPEQDDLTDEQLEELLRRRRAKHSVAS